MKCSQGNDNILQKLVLLLFLVAVPAFAWGQKKTSAPAPKPSAPAQHASAPAHSAAPAQRPSTGSRSSAPGGAHAGNTAGNRTGTAGGNHAGNATGNHAGNTAGNRAGAAGNRAGNATGNHAGNAAGNHAGNTAGNRTGNAAGNRAGTVGGNKPGNAMGKGSAGGNRAGNAAGSRGNRTPPGKNVSLKGGGKASIRPNGKIRSVDRNGMHIQHSVNGRRRVESTRNGARVVTTGKHSGYVQRAYVSRNGRTYVSRTTVVNNVSYTNVYRSYGYGGYCCYYGYAPAYYYNPGYYGWAYNPWPAPAPYAWGWGGSPWYGYYGAYYQPYPVYPSAAFWLTDYLIAANLQAAYAAQAEAEGAQLNVESDQLFASMSPWAPAAASSAAAMSAEVKQALADEIKAQLAADQAEAGKSGSGSGQQAAKSDDVLPALDPSRRVFVVADDLTLVVDGDECALTQGDVIKRIDDTPDEDKQVTVSVLASKKADCAVGKEGGVSLDDLQEMHNHFREQLTGGMGELAKKQGKDGLPKAPDTSTKDGEVPAPPPDNNAAKALQEQQSAADQTETQVKQEAASDSSGGAQ